MKFWKILGGVSIGVGAIAAAPFTGGGSVLGAATLLGSLAGASGTAAVAGIVGGIVGANIPENKTKKSNTTKHTYHKPTTTKNSNIKKPTPFNIFTILNIESQIEKEEFIIMLTEFGIAIANSDGEIHKKELIEIQKYNNLVQKNNNLSYNAKEKIKDIINNKNDLTNFKKLFKQFILTKNTEYINKIVKILDNVLEKIILADGQIKEGEIKIKNEWKEFSKEIITRNVKPNIILVGASGVGKSSMINLILGNETAPTGVGKPLTKGIKRYGDDNSIVNIYDTEGFEIGKEVYFKNMIKSIINNKSEKIHSILHIISASSHRVTDFDKNLNLMLRTFNIPVAEIFSKIDEINSTDIEPMIYQLYQDENYDKAFNSSSPPFFTTTSSELFENNYNLNIDKVISWTYNQI